MRPMTHGAADTINFKFHNHYKTLLREQPAMRWLGHRRSEGRTAVAIAHTSNLRAASAAENKAPTP